MPDAGVVFDGVGNLYGTTNEGGYYGFGTVYQLSPSGGTWKYKVIKGFTNRNNAGDGETPYSTPVVDIIGNVYGTTIGGGSTGRGTVYELSPQIDGSWGFSTIYSFPGESDGYGVKSIVFGPDGNLYGTAAGGGAGNWGTVFELARSAGGDWSETVLHSFTGGADGQFPWDLTFDSLGNIFGVTETGGGDGDGTVFELPRNPDGSWGSETVIHNFEREFGDGKAPYGKPVIDGAGNIYVTTSVGGFANRGGLFELSPVSGGSWVETTLHIFSGGNDGYLPLAGPVLDSAGNLYGTTQFGGTFHDGTAWKITAQ